MTLTDSSSALLIQLAHVQGLRKRQGGKHQKRFSPVKSESAGVRFRGERVRYAMEEDGFRSHIQALYQSFLSGEIGISEFYKTFSKDLYRFQVTMFLLGRRAMGREDSKLSEEEARMLHGAHSQEMRYFNGFIRDYIKGEGKMSYAQRLDLYALGGYRLYLRGAVYSLPDAHTARFPWKRNPEAESCEDCEWKEEESARRGGFTLQELETEIGFPGEKSRCCDAASRRSCLRRCRCHLITPGDRQLPRTRPTAFKAVKRRKTSAPKTKQSKAPTPRSRAPRTTR